MDIDIMANESGGCVDETRTPYAGAVHEDEIDKQPGKSRLLREKNGSAQEGGPGWILVWVPPRRGAKRAYRIGEALKIGELSVIDS